jgi:hypothetical protein
MNRRSSGFFGTALASAVLSASLVLVAFGAGTTNADRTGLRKHGASDSGVTVDGALAQDGQDWLIKLTATSSKGKAQDCKVAASLTSVTSSVMSRVIPAPQVVWQMDVAVKVPASGTTSSELKVPERFSKRLAPPAPKKDGDALDQKDLLKAHESFSVQLKATCEAADDDHIS